MRIVVFCHSLISDWNHGNAHFLRGIASELLSLGHELRVFEPEDAWSVQNLVQDHGASAIQRFQQAYPELHSTRYRAIQLDLSDVLSDVDMVLVHEWSDPELVRRIGEHHAFHSRYTLFFHDTHHRAITAPHEMRQYDLRHYDGVLAFGEIIRQLYLDNQWVRRGFTWHEAADTRRFYPFERVARRGELVWIGNFGDEERTAELKEFLIDPVRKLGIRATVYGVRYPESAITMLREAGIEYGGYLPNWEVPRVFAEHRMTVHIPRRPYATRLPGIPTIRPFEAMACGVPLISAPWTDAEGLFQPGSDYQVVDDGASMVRAIRLLLDRPTFAQDMAARARSTILGRHTCAHRVRQLLEFHRSVLGARPEPGALLAPEQPLSSDSTRARSHELAG